MNVLRNRRLGVSAASAPRQAGPGRPERGWRTSCRETSAMKEEKTARAVMKIRYRKDDESRRIRPYRTRSTFRTAFSEKPRGPLM